MSLSSKIVFNNPGIWRTGVHTLSGLSCSFVTDDIISSNIVSTLWSFTDSLKSESSIVFSLNFARNSLMSGI